MKRIIILSMLLFVALAAYAQKKKTVQKKLVWFGNTDVLKMTLKLL